MTSPATSRPRIALMCASLGCIFIFSCRHFSYFSITPQPILNMLTVLQRTIQVSCFLDNRFFGMSGVGFRTAPSIGGPSCLLLVNRQRRQTSAAVWHEDLTGNFSYNLLMCSCVHAIVLARFGPTMLWHSQPAALALCGGSHQL